MKKKILFLLCAAASLCFAEFENSLQKAMETINASKTLYNLKVVDEPFPVPDRSKLINVQVYREKTPKGYVIKNFEPSGEAKKLFEKAESYFSARQLEKARDAYTLALQQDPKLYSAITYIGQTYGIEKNWDRAELWYKKAIDANYIDFMAHWFLADVYLAKGQKEKALEEISIAKVLNRNNPRLEAKRKEIFDANGLEIKNWTFNPQFRISRDSVTGNVNMVSDSIWMYYAFIQAAWMYEPEYKAKAKKSLMPETMYLECLMGFLPYMDNKKIKDSVEAIKRFDKALDAKKSSEFILYEMILPDYPATALTLTKKQIEYLKDYLIWINRK